MLNILFHIFNKNDQLNKINIFLLHQQDHDLLFHFFPLFDL